jgi:hypothetical protein
MTGLVMMLADQASNGAGAFMVVAGLLGAVVIWIWGLVDALLVPDDSLYRSGSKVMWVCLIILLGFIGAVIYAAVGSPTGEERSRYASVRERKSRGMTVVGSPTSVSDVTSNNEHDVYAVDGFFTCAADDCDFETSNIAEARRHQESDARAAPVHEVLQDPETSTYWCRACDFQSQDLYDADVHSGRIGNAANTSVSPPVAAPAEPEFKTCPDCAEEVRFAARKCRFCGYMFAESADVSG